MAVKPSQHGHADIDGPNMKILQVSPFDYGVRGGVNEHIAQLDHEFARLGHETRILAATSPGVGEVDDGHIYKLGTAIPVPSNGSTARITLSPFVLTKVKGFLEREQFDIVHMHEPLAPMLPLACLRFSESLNVGTFHAARTTNLWYLYTKAILDLFVDRLDVRIAVSQSARAFADDHFPGEYSIIPNGIDLERFNPQVTPVTEYVDGHKNILFVGRFDEPRKGFIHLLRALPHIRSQFPSARLIVVGKGNIQRWMNYLEQNGIEDVIFVGAAKPDDLPRYYATCDVYCSPATGRESFGIVLLEALATGAPVVASNIPGYAGVITNGQTGMLAEPKDPHSLALAIVRILADAELRERLLANGIEHVKEFSWTKVAEQVIGVYERGLAMRRTEAVTSRRPRTSARTRGRMAQGQANG